MFGAVAVDELLGFGHLLDHGVDGPAHVFLGLGRGEEEAQAARRPVGFYIQKLDENGPAYRSGLQPGDRIISFNGQPISHSFGLLLQIDEIAPGAEVRIQIARRGGDGSEMILLYRFIAGAR